MKKLIMLAATAFGVGSKETPQSWTDIKKSIIATTCVFNQLKEEKFQKKYHLPALPSDIGHTIIAYAFDKRDREGLTIQHRIVDNLLRIDDTSYDTILTRFITHQGLLADADGNTLLHKFCLPKYLHRAQFLMSVCKSNNLNYNSVNKYGLSVVDKAIMAGNNELLILLLPSLSESYINSPNKFGNTILHRAVMYGNYQATKLLISTYTIPLSVNEFGESPTDIAQRLGYSQILSLFATTYKTYSSQLTPRYSTKEYIEETLLRSAKKLHRFLECKIDLTKLPISFLSYAFRHDRRDIVVLLLEYGVNPDEEVDNKPIIEIVPRLEDKALLLSYGANPNSAHHTLYPFILTILTTRPDLPCAKLLLRYNDKSLIPEVMSQLSLIANPHVKELLTTYGYRYS
jgi:ankyrin repeat protein